MKKLLFALVLSLMTLVGFAVPTGLIWDLSFDAITKIVDTEGLNHYITFEKPVTFELKFFAGTTGETEIEFIYLDGASITIKTSKQTFTNSTSGQVSVNVPTDIIRIRVKSNQSSQWLEFKNCQLTTKTEDALKDTITYFVDTCGLGTGENYVENSDIAGYDITVNDNLTINDEILVDEIIIYDVNGSIIKVEDATNTIYIGDLSTGMYVALIKVGEKYVTHKFVK